MSNRKYNEEILTQVLDEKWNLDGLNIPVVVANPRIMSIQVLSIHYLHEKKGIFDYHAIAESIIERLKKAINDEAQQSPKVTLVPWEDGKMIKGVFNPDKDGKFWGDVGVIGRMKALFAPMPHVTLSDNDLALLKMYELDNL
jgi:hypothetical protein